MRIAIAGVVVLVACGDSSSATPDANEPDGRIDPSPDALGDSLACTPTGGSGDVIVDGPSGAATLEVVFIAHDATGAVSTRSAMMGSDASVTLTVPSCGLVTIFDRDPAAKSSQHALTWANVQPGDHLVHSGRRPTLATRAVQVQLPPLAGATKYQITMACSLFSTSIAFNPMPGPVDMTPQCPPGAQSISVLATATTPAGTSAALEASTPLAAVGTTIVTLPAYQPVGTVVANIHGASAFANGTIGVAALATVAADRVLLVGFAQSALAGADAMVSPVPALAGNSMLQVDVVGDSAVTPRRTVRILRGLAAVEAAVGIDVGHDALPNPTGTIDTTAARPKVTWGADRPFTADFAFLELDENAGEDGHINWRMFAPGRPGTVRFPELPPDLLPAGAVPRLKGLGLLDASELSSYEEARTRLNQLLSQPRAPGTQLLLSDSRY